MKRPDLSRFYVRRKVIGRGMYGWTYLTCIDSRDNCEYVVKEADMSQLSTSVNEIFALLDIADKKPNIVPKIYDFFYKKEVGGFFRRPLGVCIVMEKLEKCSDMEPTLSDKVKAILSPIPFGEFANYNKELTEHVRGLAKQAESIGWRHLDLHPGNIMCTFMPSGSKAYILIDWGLSVSDNDEMITHPWRDHLVGLIQKNQQIETGLQYMGIADPRNPQHKDVKIYYDRMFSQMNWNLGIMAQKKRNA